jgi:Zn-finger nucleic acid-binding protein
MGDPYREGAPREAADAYCLYCGRQRTSYGHACAGCGAEPPVTACIGCGRPVPAPLEVCVCGVACPAWADRASGDLPCPRCGGATLRRVELDVTTVHVEQCARCLGSFVRTRDYSEFLAREQAGEAVGVRHFVPLAPGRELPRQTLLALVHCPHCRKEMERVRFAGHAFLLVDVCAVHGIWLDAGELVSLVNFVKQRASGTELPDPVDQEEERMWARVEVRMKAEAAVVNRHVTAAETQLRSLRDRASPFDMGGMRDDVFIDIFAALRDRLR